MAATSPEPLKLQNASEVDQECMAIADAFKGKESEETWEARERALQRFRRLLAGQAHQFPNFFTHLKTHMEFLIQSVSDLALQLRSQLDPYNERLVMNLLKLSTQSKKLLVTMAGTSLLTLIQHTSFQVRILERLAEASMEKSASSREKAVEAILALIVTAMTNESSKALLMRSQAVEILEKVLIKTLGDASGIVREKSRDIYHFYELHWASRFTNGLEPAVKKSLSRAKSGNASVRSQQRPASARSKFSLSQPTQPITVNETGQDDIPVLLTKISGAPSVHRVGLIRQLCRSIQMEQQQQETLGVVSPADMKQMIYWLEDNDSSVVEVVLNELLPLLAGRPELQESMSDAVPLLMVLKAHPALSSMAEAFLARIIGNCDEDQIWETILRCLSPIPFQPSRSAARARQDREHRMFVQLQTVEWILQIFNRDQQFPPHLLQSLINKLAALTELLPSNHQGPLAAALRECYKQNPQLFATVLSTFDETMTDAVKELIPGLEEPTHAVPVTANSTFIADHELDASFMMATMPSFADHETSFAIHQGGDYEMDENADHNMSFGTPQRSTKREIELTPTAPSSGFDAMDTDLTPKANATASLVGSGPMHVALTPLMKQKPSSKAILMTPANTTLASEGMTPGSSRRYSTVRSASDLDGRLTQLLHRLSCGQVSDKVFRKLYRWSKDYIVGQQNTGDLQLSAAADIWQRRFPEVLDVLLNFMDKTDEEIEADPMAQRENAMIVIKHMYAEHQELFQGLEAALIRKCVVIRSLGEVDPKLRISNRNGSLCAIAADLSDMLIHNFDRVRMANLLIDILIQAPAESSSIGVAFQCLARLVEVQYAKDPLPDNDDLLPLERNILHPLWHQNLIRKHIQSNPIVYNRKSLYDFLLSCWRVMGDTLVSKYLLPTEDATRKSGLPLPSFRLFQVLVQQEHRRLQPQR